MQFVEFLPRDPMNIFTTRVSNAHVFSYTSGPSGLFYIHIGLGAERQSAEEAAVGEDKTVGAIFRCHCRNSSPGRRRDWCLIDR